MEKKWLNYKLSKFWIAMVDYYRGQTNMEIKGKPFREYMQLLNLLIYWDIMDYNEKERKEENDQTVSIQSEIGS